MRRKLLTATVESLQELGYTRTSTLEVTRRARVSRGAHLHHFPTKASLVAAAVEQVFEDRLRDVGTFVGRMTEGAMPTPEAIFDYIWKIYSSGAFYAWLELLVASRTDRALRKHVQAVDRRFVARAEKLVADTLGAALRGPRDVQAATRLVLSIFDGLALHAILEKDEDEKRAVFKLFSFLVREAFTR